MGVHDLHWYYIENMGAPGEPASMSGDEWHHCHNVLRLREGDLILITDGKGAAAQGRIKTALKQTGVIEIISDFRSAFFHSRPYKVSIGLAPTKNMERTEFAIEKLVELGVDEICFLDCRHNERQHLRMDRIEKIVISAAKQSRKIYFPSIRQLTSPATYIKEKKNAQPDVNVLCCHLDGETKSISENYFRGQDVLMLIGPEGGFAQEEIDEMKSLNVQMTHLGPYRLRVETAAITACANIHFLNEMNL